MSTIEKAVVKGTKGIAEFALKHIEQLSEGCTVDFAEWYREEFDGDIEKFAASSEHWYGICDISAKSNKVSDMEDPVLFADYYGGGFNPQVFRVDGTGYATEERNIMDFARKLADLTESEGEGIRDDEYIYVELNRA